MISKKSPRTRSHDRPYQRQLDYLYARRSAIDRVIELLVEYQRHREKRLRSKDNL